MRKLGDGVLIPVPDGGFGPGSPETAGSGVQQLFDGALVLTVTLLESAGGIQQPWQLDQLRDVGLVVNVGSVLRSETEGALTGEVGYTQQEVYGGDSAGSPACVAGFTVLPAGDDALAPSVRGSVREGSRQARHFATKFLCASCPYRMNVPSGVWDESEYRKLTRYDGEIFEQGTDAIFMCHQGCGSVCSGWLGHRPPEDLLAVRMGLMRKELDRPCLDYRTEVPLFPTGAEAARHGMKDAEAPRHDAVKAISKIARNRHQGAS